MKEKNRNISKFEDDGGAVYSEEQETLGDLCPTCKNWTLVKTEGCSTCLICGYSLCDI